jgi:acetyl-CoA carboxylase biotin carboxyl carrier protein
VTDLTREDVQQILDLIDKAQYDYFELQDGDLRLIVNRTGLPMPGLVGSGPVAPAPGPAPVSPSPPPSAAASAPTLPAAPPAATPPPIPAAADRAGLVAVNAPMVGTFYAQPEPGAPPFVQVGAQVDDETTMGLIEAMKVFTAVRAGVRGTVAEIVVRDTEFVEFGRPLFYVRPAAAG